MPLFKSRPEVDEADNHQASPTTSSARKGSIFSSKHTRSLSPTLSNTSKSLHSGSSTRRGGFFRHRNSSTSSTDSGHDQRNSIQSGRKGRFGMGHGNASDRDPTILNARQKVTAAEEAEKEADRALLQARGMVKEAQEHVRILEEEATEDTRRAKAKQAEAQIVSKVARGLGRHGT